MKIKRVVFLGGAEFKPGDEVYEAAFKTARLLAERGGVIGVTYYPKQKHPTYKGRDH